MSSRIEKIAVVGAGAVGGYYGARLAQHGQDVHFLLRSDYDAVERDGWRIQSVDGDFDLTPKQIHIYRRAEQMPTADLVIVALKTTSNDQFQSLIGPLVRDNTRILTLQNGLGNEQMLAELFGPTRVLGGLAFTCINRIGPGQIHHMDHGLIRLGHYEPGQNSTAAAIADLFNRSRIRCEVLDDLRYGRWEKLIWNVPFNGLGAALDLSADRLIANDHGTALVTQLMGEIVATARSIGVQLPSELIPLKIEQTRSMGAYKTSMQIDRQCGRPMEIEAIIAKPLAIARGENVTTPLLDVLYRMLTAMATK
jgi:2-dehydropantoate 2-reductase